MVQFPPGGRHGPPAEPEYVTDGGGIYVRLRPLTYDLTVAYEPDPEPPPV